jgi:hypothetical protein
MRQLPAAHAADSMCALGAVELPAHRCGRHELQAGVAATGCYVVMHWLRCDDQLCDAYSTNDCVLLCIPHLGSCIQQLKLPAKAVLSVCGVDK